MPFIHLTPILRHKMKLFAVKIFWVVLLAALFLMPPGAGAQKKPPTPQPGEIRKEQPPEVPDLADLLLQASCPVAGLRSRPKSPWFRLEGSGTRFTGNRGQFSEIKHIVCYKSIMTQGLKDLKIIKFCLNFFR